MTNKESQENLTWADYITGAANMLTRETLRRLCSCEPEKMSTHEMVELASTLMCAIAIGEKSEAWRAYAEKRKATEQ